MTLHRAIPRGSRLSSSRNSRQRVDVLHGSPRGGVEDGVVSRVLQPIADDLEIPKRNFQILRWTIATRAQKLGSVKDIQSHLQHSRADTTANEYMQELPESVQQMVGTVYELLTAATTPQQIM
jgi:integrase